MHLAWDPRSAPFEPWKTFRGDSSLAADVESFYSIFQCYALTNILTPLTCRVWLEQFGIPSESNPQKVGDTLAEVGRRTVESVRKHRRGEDASLLCQILSARYYFHTQGDQRTITVPSSDFDKWDWWEFSRKWDAIAVAQHLGLTPEAVSKIHEDVEFITSSDDPLQDWYELVSFVALRKREKLKGKARLAQLGYAMEHMLRLFYRDLTRETLPLPDEGGDWNRMAKYGDGVKENPLRHLEYLVNEYNLNPRPKAIFIVEGAGEASEIPRLALNLFGHNFAKAAIEVRSLGGVDEFTGHRRLHPEGALEKLIDDYHARQTLVFVVIDNENRAEQVRARLLAARSRLVPQRKLTKPEYVHLWRQTFEFDNFSDAEIATALSSVADGRYSFTESEVASCRAAWVSSKRDHLSTLYRDRLSYDLNKKSLMAHLVDLVISNRKSELPDGAEPKRPIVAFVKQVIELVAYNHQPESDEGWLRNQKTGYFGDFDAG